MSCSGGIFYVACSGGIIYVACNRDILMCRVVGVF